jgi:hypothetical protein
MDTNPTAEDGGREETDRVDDAELTRRLEILGPFVEKAYRELDTAHALILVKVESMLQTEKPTSEAHTRLLALKDLANSGANLAKQLPAGARWMLEVQLPPQQKLDAALRLVAGNAINLDNYQMALCGTIAWVLEDNGLAPELRTRLLEVARDANQAAKLNQQLLDSARRWFR